MERKIISFIGWVMLALAIVFLVAGRNNVVNAREEVLFAEAQVQTMIQRRSELIPQLVDVVKGYVEHEENIFTLIADSHENIANAITNSSFSESLEADKELSDMIDELLSLANKYPELKTNESFIALQYDISGSENRINIARRNYNETVMTYNKYVKTFPGIVYARFFGYEEMAYFEADNDELPEIDFD